MKKILLPTAYGTRDIIGLEAYNKRIMENKIADIFIKWGYQEVVTPTYEYLSTFDLGSERTMAQESIKFFDRDNKTLMLRPDMTTPLARLVSSRLTCNTADVDINKLFYIANVFRHEQTQSGRQCEFYQAGVEFFGSSCALADAEVIALAVEAMRSTGLTDFKINLGHVDFINGLLSELQPQTQEQVKIFLSTKDVVSLETLFASDEFGGDTAGILGNIVYLKGDVSLLEDIKAKNLNPVSRAALDNLLEIYAILKSYDIQDYIVFDLSLTRDMQYYSGMVFEAYTSAMGYPICGGGRYDRMMDAFGKNCPATGFALGIERITLLLSKEGLLQKPANRKILLSWNQGSLDKAIKQATALQARGYITTVAIKELSQSEIKQLEQQKIYDEIIIM